MITPRSAEYFFTEGVILQRAHRSNTAPSKHAKFGVTNTSARYKLQL
jgi:hypothetical protein